MKEKFGIMTLTALSAVSTACMAQSGSAVSKLPNVVYILADDLGIGDLGCYGQKRIKTPAIDGIAQNGMLFTQCYSGSTVSAPSRCCLVTGKHTGHAAIRGNSGSASKVDGQTYDGALPAEEITVGEIMKQKNYATACIGKWGLGGPDSEGHPNKQGFDYFFGYLGQGRAHRYYTDYLWENEHRVMLNKQFYSADTIAGKALEFIDRNAGKKPFFLLFTPTIPHADIIVPEGERGEYENAFPEKPYVNNNKNGRGYISQPKPNATYAAMVARLDSQVKAILDLLKKKGVLNNTIVIFTSDNGNHKEGGHDPEFFDSNGPFRGIKRDMYEGGIRTPFLVQWPDKIQKGFISHHISAFWDFLPTMCELVGMQKPANIDGISYLPTISGIGEQQKHEYLYWEFYERGGKRAVLKDNWKLIVLDIDTPESTQWELYNLDSDPGEQVNVIDKFPEKVAELKTCLEKARTFNPKWRFATEAH